MTKPRHSVTFLRSCASLCFVFSLYIQSSFAANPIQVEQVWLKRNCLDRGNADRPLRGEAFEACLKKKVEGLPPLDRSKRELFGERYDPAQYVKCRLGPNGRNNSACNVYILHRREWPEYWPEGSRRIKWPDPPQRTVYKRGMKSKEYWAALCSAEAGEFPHRTINNVEGVFAVRPRGRATDMEMRDRNVLEDPFSISDILGNPKLEAELVQPYAGEYRFLEVADLSKGLVRHERVEPSNALSKTQTVKDGNWMVIPYIVQSRSIDKPSARYGFTWRGIQRPHDRENGIAGAEVAVVDLQTGEILAIRRGFALSGSEKRSPSGFWWIAASRCPDDKGAPLRNFLYRVLKPLPDVNVNIRPLGK